MCVLAALGVFLCCCFAVLLLLCVFVVCLVAVLQESSRFTRAMKDNKFRDLLQDYMKEIADPANKQVTTETKHTKHTQSTHTRAWAWACTTQRAEVRHCGYVDGSYCDLCMRV